MKQQKYKKERIEILENVGKAIATKRKKKNISQERLSEYLGITKSTLSRYETGKTEIPVSLLPMIGKLCDTKIDYYFRSGNIEKAAILYMYCMKMLDYGKSRDIEPEVKEQIDYVFKEELKEIIEEEPELEEIILGSNIDELPEKPQNIEIFIEVIDKSKQFERLNQILLAYASRLYDYPKK